MKFKISTYIKELFLFLLLVAATLLVLIATHKASHTRTIVINEVCSNDFSLVENSAGKYADYIFIAPQIKHDLYRVKELLPEKPIEVIDPFVYGQMNGQELVVQIVEKLGK